MKGFLKVMGFIFALITTIILFVLEVGLGITTSASKFLSKENISANIEKIEIKEILEDKEGNPTKVGTEIYSSLEGIGLTKEQTNKLLSNQKLKKIFGDYTGSIVVNKINPEEPITYPKKQELVELVEENYETLAVSLELDNEFNEETKAQIKELIDAN